MYEYEKNILSSEDDFIYRLSNLPILTYSVFKYENIETPSRRLNR